MNIQLISTLFLAENNLFGQMSTYHTDRKIKSHDLPSFFCLECPPDAENKWITGLVVQFYFPLLYFHIRKKL